MSAIQLSSYGPDSGDDQIALLQRINAVLAFGFESPVVVLALAARLGTNLTPALGLRGYKGALLTNRITAVAGVGTVQSYIQVSNNGTNWTDAVNSAAGLTATHQVAIYPGAANTGTHGYHLGGAGLYGRYFRVGVNNSSAVGGNEVTCELTIYLVK